MAWERRQRGGQYYYRSRRVDGRVVKQYFGRGSAAKEAAAADQAARARHEEASAISRTVLNGLVQAAGPLEQLCEECDMLVEASLLAAGFHCHRGSWRKRNG